MREKALWDAFKDSDKEDLNIMYVCAVRYSIGRMTYMPSLVTEFIMKHSDTLTVKGASIMIRDIEEERDRYVPESISSLGRTSLGMECDQRTWLNFLDWLKAWKEEHDVKG